MTLSTFKYGNPTRANAMHNAQLIINWFGKQKIQVQAKALCAMLGNMYHESGIDPHRYEAGYAWSADRGYGLTQWTPRSKLASWCRSKGLDYTTAEGQLQRLKCEIYEQGCKQWIEGRGNYFANLGLDTRKYNGYTFQQFLKGDNPFKDDINNLTKMFTTLYEAPAAQYLETSQPQRAGFAREAYDKLDFSAIGGDGKKKTHHIIWAGHGSGDPGAIGHYPHGEHHYFSNVLIPEMKKHCPGGRCTFITEYDVLTTGALPKLVKKHGGPKNLSMTELHYDSAGGAGGGHIILPYQRKATDRDKRVVDVIKKYFGIIGHKQHSGGVDNSRQDLGNPNHAAREKVDYRLIELFDGSHELNVKTAVDKAPQIAKDLMDALLGDETDSDYVPGPGEDSQPGIDFSNLFKDFRKQVEDMLSADIYDSGGRAMNYNKWLRIHKQMNNMYKVRPNLPFLDVFDKFFDLLGSLIGAITGGGTTDPSPPPPSPDPGGDDGDSPTPPSTSGMVFPLDYVKARKQGINVNFWKKSKHAPGTLPHAMGFNTPRPGHMHRGYDIGAPNGIKVYNVKSGKVLWTGWFGSGGNTVRIQFDEPVTVGGQTTKVVQYLHLSSIHVSAGQQIKTGQVIGLVGGTGGNYAPHLHIEFWRGLSYGQSINDFVDPEIILRVTNDNHSELPTISQL